MDIIAVIIALIVPIGVAIWTVRSSAKDTANQIKSIKELSRLQIEATIKQVELEIEKNLFLANQAQQEWEEIDQINNSGMASQVQWKEIRMQQFREQKPERDYHLYNKFIEDLKTIKRGLEVNKKKLD